MAFPKHVDRDLVASALAMAGIPEADIQRALSRGNDPQVIWDSVMGRDYDDRTRKALELAGKYITTLSGTDLKKFLVEGRNLPESVVSRAIAQSGQDDTIAQVLERIGQDNTQYTNKASTRQKIAGMLGTVQTMGLVGLNKSKKQYMAPGQGQGTGQAQQAVAAGNQVLSAAKRAVRGPARPGGGQSLLDKAGVGFMTNLGAPGAGSISMDVPKDKAGIMNLQRLLNERGANLKVDGIYGPNTKAAHQQYGTGQIRTTGPGGLTGETLGSTLTGGTGSSTVGAPQAANVAPPLSATASDAEVEAYIRRNFGFAAWALDVPEIRQTLVNFTKRMQGYEFSEAQLEAELLNTEWWKEKNNKQRARIEEFHSDPMTYNQGVDDELTTLRGLATNAGMNISDDRLREMAAEGYKMGWSQADRQAALAAEFDYNPETGTQAASALVGELRSAARNYLVPLSEATIDEWGKKLIEGTATMETVNGYLREQAKQMLPSFAQQIDAGLTPQALVEPYRQNIARELGSDPNTVDFLDPKWNRFINTMDPKTGTARPMSFFEIQQTIRTDSSYGWDKSDTAHREATEFATQLAQRFGRAG